MDVLASITAFPISFGILAVAAYLGFLATSRLLFSPIAKFPGPKLAALTHWYEFYYEIILKGQFTFKIRELHSKYGPIVRINPHELHVSDPDFYDTLYAGGGKRREKWQWHTRGLGLNDSMLATVDHDLHRRRRMAVSGFFSTQSARRLQPLIHERVETLVGRLRASTDSGKVIPMNFAYAAFSNDVVMEYCFGRSDHRLEDDGFDPDFYHTSMSAATNNPLMRQMNWILKLMFSLPESIVVLTGPEMASFVTLRNERISQIEQVKKNPGKGKQDSSHTTIFHEALAGSLPESEKSTDRLAQEAVLLVGAGTHTVSWTLTLATYHILANPSILRSVKEELEGAIENSADYTPLATIEKLPYLTAVIKEALRLGYGVPGRLPRVSPDAPLQFNEWVIPAGTPISLSSTLIHHDESIFPESYSFKPERWINDPSGHLDRHLVAFTKGSRSCLGMPLAWAELYLCLAGIFRRFGSGDVRSEDDLGALELFETDRSDVEMVGEMFFPLVKKESKGVRVKVTGIKRT